MVCFNLSSKIIPEKVVSLVQLGDKFCLPAVNNNRKIIFETIKDIEYNIRNLSNDKCSIRSHIFPILDKYINTKHIRTDTETFLLGAFRETIKFTKNNPDLFFVRADKGSVTVALDKSMYVERGFER